MKPKLTCGKSRLSLAVTLLITGSMAQAQIVTVDGFRDEFETYVERSVQQTTSNWGVGNAIVNLHTTQEGSNLYVHLAGRAQGNAVIVFIDSKAEGLSFVPNNLITTGGEENTINNLGTSPTAGLTFEDDFRPDYAVRIYGAGADAYVNRYDLTAASPSRVYVGNSGSGSAKPSPSGFVSEIKTDWFDVAEPFADAVLGVEMALNLVQLGVPAGNGHPVKIMAVLVNGDSNFASNQVLNSRTSTTVDIGNAINSINFQTEPGTQTISFTVDNSDTDGDGIPDEIDEDDDNDGLLDIHETNDGNYLSPTVTGSNPLIADTDGDGLLDGAEVTGTLGYISNPNIPNYLSMAVPGNFTDPEWQESGLAGNSMTQGDTASLTGQYQWTLDYRFATLGPIEYKYAANGTWDKNWGNGSNNFAAVIQGTGFHRFSFDNGTLVQSLARTEFPDVAAYLAAYDVVSGEDSDNDGLNNEAEYLANTDPTNPDTDNDGVGDAADSNPLAATRSIVFSVDMSVQEALGNFDPDFDAVVVDFFTGQAAGLADLALTPVGNGIWTGTLTEFPGQAESLFGDYKFKNNRQGAPAGGYEGSIDNRNFNLGIANTTQTLDLVFFDNNSAMPGDYTLWAETHAQGQSPDMDHDGDGVANGVEFFMGEIGSTFTPNPAVVNGMITWPHSASATGATFKVWTSENLSDWEDVTDDAVDNGGSVRYMLPDGNPSLFVRLEVNVP